ncbi:MAG TPA: hypothetical protein VGF27_25230 [Pseudoduganella sp.]
MTMPLYIDKFDYAKYLRDGGVEPVLAELYAEALAAGLYQEVVQPTDLALAEAKITAYYKRDMDERNARIDRTFRPIYWILAVMMVMHTITLVKLFS